MAKQTIASVVTRLIAETKKLELQLNTTTTLAKGAQPALTQPQINILGGEVFTSAEKTKLGTAVTEATLTAKGYATTAAIGGKQDTLTAAQKAVVDAKPFTAAYKASLDNMIAGGRYLGEFSVPDGWTIANIKAELNTQYPSAITGDHIEIIQAGVNSGDINYITYTKGLALEWSAGTAKNVHIKGGSVDSYTKAESDGRYAPIGDVSMDDAEMTALEAIVVTS